MRALADTATAGAQRYLPWDQFRNRRPPDGLSSEDWWLISKFSRQGMMRPLPLNATGSDRFTYALPDEVLRGIDVVDKHLSGRLGVPEPVTQDAPSRARYVVTSLIEEAITSSQLESASTTHQVAKQMLPHRPTPPYLRRTDILNNYRN